MSPLFSQETLTAPADFQRWRIPPASIAIHLCIGSVYAWSVFNGPLGRVRGVVAPAADDWSFAQTNGIYMTALVCLGLSAAVAGKWMEQVGPRVVGTIAAVCWSSGFALAGLGILKHWLWLVYAGYGMIGGCGLGLGYVSPVSTLIKWFPDRRGMATGMAIMGFGGGALLGTPLKEYLMREYFRAPVYLGRASEVSTVTVEGRRMADVAGRRIEVVEVGANELNARVGKPGVYVVGTGSTGVAQTFFALGGLYLAIMLPAALSYRLPAAGWAPAGWNPPASQMIATEDLTVREAVRTPQFYLLWLILCLNVTAGIGMIGAAKTIVGDLFRSSLPQLVTDGFAATYVQMASVFNMGGRFAWASLSDRLGRKLTYAVFFLLGCGLYLAIPWCARESSVVSPTVRLGLFYFATMVIVSMYGGGFATIPAYLADLFGTKFVGGIHGRLLTAWSTAAVVGTLTLAQLRESSRRAAIERLSALVSPEAFAGRFGSPPSDLPVLVERNVVTIPKLLEMAPSGTPDPSSELYNSTMWLMAGLLAVGAIANWFVRPVDSKHHLAG
ncbi:MAG: OFA family MFS transporter [Planctomycetaceae bacterium]